MEKIAIVTGSSSGFGLYICIELAKAGFTVIATMRDLSKKHVISNLNNEPLIQRRIRIVQLDVTDPQSIQTFQSYIQSLPSIDLLVNNAGFAQAGFVEEVNMNSYRKQFETNVYGTISITQAVIPYMRVNQSGTIIIMSSVSGCIGFPGLSAYVSSKHALEGFAESLRLELAPFHVNVALIEPGSYQTNIWKVGLTNIKGNEHSPYKTMLSSLQEHVKEASPTYGHPKEVAQLIVKLAQKKKVKQLRYPIGKGVRIQLLFKKFIPWPLWQKLVLNRIRMKNNKI
ncbi:SDR family oxidoreductase [Bacillus sp. JCM 19034]|uniref:SDR family oxidoreductase n=1 Tax=Bacillus sp. JCM 19034 TaxID=1481928 RepID=UPI000784450F|nr:SDR family oxidoreductase [Bacillus sp. JCM 19034]